MNGQKVFVSERAALQRVNRALAHEGKAMKVCRENSRWFNDFGRIYVISTDTQILDSASADIEDWARHLGVLKPFEEISIGAHEDAQP